MESNVLSSNQFRAHCRQTRLKILRSVIHTDGAPSTRVPAGTSPAATVRFRVYGNVEIRRRVGRPVTDPPERPTRVCSSVRETRRRRWPAAAAGSHALPARIPRGCRHVRFLSVARPARTNVLKSYYQLKKIFFEAYNP